MMEHDEFVSYLETKFPEMYSNVYCGIESVDGWQHIIISLSENIYSHVKNNNRVRESLLKKNPYDYDIPEYLEFPKVAQIKEKFGGLRFYIDGGDQYIRGLIDMAEMWAANTCEICGERGEHRDDAGSLSTLCQKHYEEKKLNLSL
jgi:hypothetical protein